MSTVYFLKKKQANITIFYETSAASVIFIVCYYGLYTREACIKNFGNRALTILNTPLE